MSDFLQSFDIAIEHNKVMEPLLPRAQVNSSYSGLELLLSLFVCYLFETYCWDFALLWNDLIALIHVIVAAILPIILFIINCKWYKFFIN